MSETVEAKDKFTLPLANIDLTRAAVSSILAKGGACSIDVLSASVGKSEGMIRWAIRTCSEFGLVETDGDQYKLTKLGSKFAASTDEEQKKLMREIVLRYEPYNTVLLRIKNAKDKTIQKSDIKKAWYELQKSGTDSTREANTSAFASIAAWCGLIDSRPQTVALVGDLEPTGPAQTIQASKIDGATAVPAQLPTVTGDGRSAQSSPTAAPVSLQISVDAKDPTSVQNVLKIIKALRGESTD